MSEDARKIMIDSQLRPVGVSDRNLVAAFRAVDREAFDSLELGIATLSPAELGTVQAEPHPSWMTRIADDWADRYGVAQ